MKSIKFISAMALALTLSVSCGSNDGDDNNDDRVVDDTPGQEVAVVYNENSVSYLGNNLVVQGSEEYCNYTLTNPFNYSLDSSSNVLSNNDNDEVYQPIENVSLSDNKLQGQFKLIKQVGEHNVAVFLTFKDYTLRVDLECRNI